MANIDAHQHNVGITGVCATEIVSTAAHKVALELFQEVKGFAPGASRSATDCARAVEALRPDSLTSSITLKLNALPEIGHGGNVADLRQNLPHVLKIGSGAEHGLERDISTCALEVLQEKVSTALQVVAQVVRSDPAKASQLVQGLVQILDGTETKKTASNKEKVAVVAVDRLYTELSALREQLPKPSFETAERLATSALNDRYNAAVEEVASNAAHSTFQHERQRIRNEFLKLANVGAEYQRHTDRVEQILAAKLATAQQHASHKDESYQLLLEGATDESILNELHRVYQATAPKVLVQRMHEALVSRVRQVLLDNNYPIDDQADALTILSAATPSAIANEFAKQVLAGSKDSSVFEAICRLPGGEKSAAKYLWQRAEGSDVPKGLAIMNLNIHPQQINMLFLPAAPPGKHTEVRDNLACELEQLARAEGGIQIIPTTLNQVLVQRQFLGFPWAVDPTNKHFRLAYFETHDFENFKPHLYGAQVGTSVGEAPLGILALRPDDLQQAGCHTDFPAEDRPITETN